MRWPRFIYFDDKRWAVNLVDKKDLDNTWGKRYDAVGDYGDGEIRVWCELSKDERWCVLLHELLHIAWEHAGLRKRRRLRPNTEELVVSNLDKPLAVLLAENFGFSRRRNDTS